MAKVVLPENAELFVTPEGFYIFFDFEYQRESQEFESEATAVKAWMENDITWKQTIVKEHIR